MGNYFGSLVGCLVLFGSVLNCNAQGWTTEEHRQVMDLQSAFRDDDQHHVAKSEPWGPGAYYDLTIDNVCGGDVEKWANRWIKPEVNLENLSVKNLSVKNVIRLAKNSAKYVTSLPRDRLVLIKATLEFGQDGLPDVIDRTIFENSNTSGAFYTCDNNLKFWGVQNDKNAKVTLKIKIVDQADPQVQKAVTAGQAAGASGFAFGGVLGAAGFGFVGGVTTYFITDSVTQTDLENNPHFPEHKTSVTIGELRRGQRVTRASLTSDNHKEWITISRVGRY
jgi:hypothetical protein